jgi:hypothetical protein
MPSWAAARVIIALPKKRRRSALIATCIVFAPPDLDRLRRRLFLRSHELTYQRRNLIRSGIESEMSCIEHLNVGIGYRQRLVQFSIQWRRAVYLMWEAGADQRFSYGWKM